MYDKRSKEIGCNQRLVHVYLQKVPTRAFFFHGRCGKNIDLHHGYKTATTRNTSNEKGSMVVGRYPMITDELYEVSTKQISLPFCSLRIKIVRVVPVAVNEI
jgi:hypothetical protein